MRMALWMQGIWPVGVCSAAVSCNNRGFLSPDDSDITRDGEYDHYPLNFNMSDTQFKGWTQIDGSFWINSFIHGSNGHDYYVASHVINYASEIPGLLPTYRASLLDVTEPSVYSNFVKFHQGNMTFWTPEGHFNASFPNFGMEAISTDDPLKGLRTYCAVDGIEFDLTFNFTSPAMMNGALASYQVGGGTGWEYSVPRGATGGWLRVGGELIEVVTEKSFSWYDRQWGSLQDAFDWVAINFEESSWLDLSVMVAWNWKDKINGQKEFATIRSSSTGRDSVVPITLTPSTTNVWMSPESGTVFPSEWLIEMDDVEIVVTTPRADQVIEGPEGVIFPSQFSGYVEAVARKAGYPPVRGYASVDSMVLD
jgi:hypothetical protein